MFVRVPLSRKEIAGQICGLAHVADGNTVGCVREFVTHSEDGAGGLIDDLNHLGHGARVVRGDDVSRGRQHLELKCLDWRNG